MDAQKPLDSAVVGRPPAENPRNVQIAFRIDQQTAESVDAELDADRRPGLVLSRNDMARILMAEALEERARKRNDPSTGTRSPESMKRRGGRR